MHSIMIYREKKNLGYPEAAKLVRRAAKTALRCQGVDADCMVSILLTNDDGIHRINLEQRGVDAPTDVLSFPMNDLEEGAFDAEACEYDYDTEKCILGDMVIDLERCAAQAEEFGHSFDREVSYLTVHSILHLLGYDHLDEGPRKRAMRAREEAVMAVLGIPE